VTVGELAEVVAIVVTPDSSLDAIPWRLVQSVWIALFCAARYRFHDAQLHGQHSRARFRFVSRLGGESVSPFKRACSKGPGENRRQSRTLVEQPISMSGQAVKA